MFIFLDPLSFNIGKNCKVTGYYNSAEYEGINNIFG